MTCLGPKARELRDLLKVLPSGLCRPADRSRVVDTTIVLVQVFIDRVRVPLFVSLRNDCTMNST